MIVTAIVLGARIPYLGTRSRIQLSRSTGETAFSSLQKFASLVHGHLSVMENPKQTR